MNKVTQIFLDPNSRVIKMNDNITIKITISNVIYLNLRINEKKYNVDSLQLILKIHYVNLII